MASELTDADVALARREGIAEGLEMAATHMRARADQWEQARLEWRGDSTTEAVAQWVVKYCRRIEAAIRALKDGGSDATR